MVDTSDLNLVLFDLAIDNRIVKKLRDSLAEECQGYNASMK